VDCGKAAVAKPFHMQTLLRGAWVANGLDTLRREYMSPRPLASLPWIPSWYFLPPTTFKQSFLSLTHSLACPLIHSFI
jgi:hypothetical protein